MDQTAIHDSFRYHLKAGNHVTIVSPEDNKPFSDLAVEQKQKLTNIS
jgi:hypothetical protein